MDSERPRKKSFSVNRQKSTEWDVWLLATVPQIKQLNLREISEQMYRPFVENFS
jgi:hypothetical protein